MYIYIYIYLLSCIPHLLPSLLLGLASQKPEVAEKAAKAAVAATWIRSGMPGYGFEGLRV